MRRRGGRNVKDLVLQQNTNTSTANPAFYLCLKEKRMRAYINWVRSCQERVGIGKATGFPFEYLQFLVYILNKKTK